MLHRSTLLAILSAVLLLPTAAQAADPVVAGPLPDGATATARVDKSELCVAVHPPKSEQRFNNEGCEAIPVLGPFGFADGLSGQSTGTIYDAGATGSDVAAVELRQDGRTLARAATQPSALPGAPDLRFYLLATTGRPDEVVYLDAAGTVRRAADFTGVRGSDFLDRGPEQTASRTLARGKGGGTGWKLTAYAISPIVATPLQPERRLTLGCVTLTLPAGDGGTSDTRSCDEPELAARQMLPLSSDDACGSVGRFTSALVRAKVAKVVLVLGSGRRVTMLLHPFPAAFGVAPGLRAGLARISAHEAIRSITAYDRAGRVLDRGFGGVAPAAPPTCHPGDGDDGGFDTSLQSSSEVFVRSSGTRGARLGAGPHQLHAADDGERICFAADRAPVVPDDCQQPPMNATQTLLPSEPTADGRLVLAIVPPEVATARLTLDDGSTRDLPAGPIAGYTGQYATNLAAIFADVPGPHRIISYKLLDARGRVLTKGAGPEYPGLRNTRRIALVPGVGTLYSSDAAVAAGVRSGLGSADCLSIGRPPAGTSVLSETCLPHTASVVTLTASCATRRIVVSAGLAHRADRVSIRLASGREVALRTYALPASRVTGQAAAQAIGVLGTRDVPRTLIRRGRKPQRLALHLPAVAAQCGYVDYALFDSPTDDD